MKDRIILVDCVQEQNLKYNDNINIVDTLWKQFDKNTKLDTAEIVVLDDDYIDYITKKGTNDNIVSRIEYINFHPHKDYDQIFINSKYSELIDSAILPVIIHNEKQKNEIFEIRIVDDIRKRLNEYLTIALNNNEASKLIFGTNTSKKIYVNDYILFLDPQIFDNEPDLIAEIMDGENYGITKKYKNLQFVKDAVFTLGFVYVIALTKLPRFITREIATSFTTAIESITDSELDIETLDNILTFEGRQTGVMLNYLIYPDEIQQTVEEWLGEMCTEYEKFKKLDAISKNHIKKGKKN